MFIGIHSKTNLLDWTLCQFQDVCMIFQLLFCLSECALENLLGIDSSVFNDLKISLSADYEILKSDSVITVDYCVLAKNIDITSLTKSYEISLFILDGSLPTYISKKLEKQCQELKINYHNLKESSLVKKF